MNGMTEKLQRTEQVITEAELRTMLDDEDVERFADVISKGLTHVRGGAWCREQDGRWRSGRTQPGRMKTETRHARGSPRLNDREDPFSPAQRSLSFFTQL